MRIAVAATAVIAVVGIVIGGWLLGQRQAHSGGHQPVTAIDAPVEAPHEHPDGEDLVPSAVEPAEVVVHVAGEVREPGIVHVPAGARAADAIDAAGGPTGDAELSAINLARIVEDGEQLYVPLPGEPMPDESDRQITEGGTSDSARGAVNLNTATSEELQTLPGIGPAMAERIITWRQTHGEFTRADQLLEIRGIGPRVFAELQDRVSV